MGAPSSCDRQTGVKSGRPAGSAAQRWARSAAPREPGAKSAVDRPWSRRRRSASARRTAPWATRCVGEQARPGHGHRGASVAPAPGAPRWPPPRRRGAAPGEDDPGRELLGPDRPVGDVAAGEARVEARLERVDPAQGRPRDQAGLAQVPAVTGRVRGPRGPRRPGRSAAPRRPPCPRRRRGRSGRGPGRRPTRRGPGAAGRPRRCPRRATPRWPRRGAGPTRRCAGPCPSARGSGAPAGRGRSS